MGMLSTRLSLCCAVLCAASVCACKKKGRTAEVTSLAEKLLADKYRARFDTFECKPADATKMRYACDAWMKGEPPIEVDVKIGEDGETIFVESDGMIDIATAEQRAAEIVARYEGPATVDCGNTYVIRKPGTSFECRVDLRSGGSKTGVFTVDAVTGTLRFDIPGSDRRPRAGPGSSADGLHMGKQLRQALNSTGEWDVRQASCPSGVELKKGVRFECEATLASGARQVFVVLVEDDEGNVDIKPKATAP